MANTFTNDIYQPTKVFSYLAIFCFGVLVFCYASNFILSFVQLVFTLPETDIGNGENTEITFVFIGLISLLQLLFRFLTIIFFLIWLYKAFYNLPALQSRNLEFSPGWAVGWWFIPFANLVKPYQVVRELWNESNSDVDKQSFLSNSVGTSPMLGYWWGLFISGNILGRIADKISETSEYFFVIFMIYCMLHGISAGLAIVIIKKITEQQDLRFHKIGTANTLQAPPPPPNFN
jgi:hypothetical protein